MLNRKKWKRKFVLNVSRIVLVFLAAGAYNKDNKREANQNKSKMSVDTKGSK